MPMFLKQNTAVTIRLGPHLDKTDGVTEEVGLAATLSVQVSKNHGAFANRNSGTAITHDQNGWYGVELNATDTNTLGPVTVKTDDAATYLPVWREFMVVPANVYEAMVDGSDKLQVDVAQWGDVNVAALISGRVDANVGAMQAAVLTAAAIAANALTNTKFAVGAIDAVALASDAVDEILDEPCEGAVTLRQSMRLLNAIASGLLNGAGGTTLAIRDLANSKDRISATVDASGNRTAVVRDLT